MIDKVAELRATRRYITAFLLNLGGVDTTEMTVSTLLITLDYLADHPDEYLEITNDQQSNPNS